MVTCQQFVEHVKLGLDGPWDASGPWRAHAEACENCARYVAQTSALAQAVRQVGQRPSSAAAAPELLAAFAANRRGGVGRVRTCALSGVAAAVVAMSALLALTPAAQAPAVQPHVSCTGIIMVAGLLPVFGTWLLLRRRARTMSVHAAAAVAGVCAFAGQALAGLGCPDLHLQRHLLLSHFGALVLAVLVSMVWTRHWAARPPLASISHRG